MSVLVTALLHGHVADIAYTVTVINLMSASLPSWDHFGDTHRFILLHWLHLVPYRVPLNRGPSATSISEESLHGRFESLSYIALHDGHSIFHTEGLLGWIHSCPD